MYCLLSSGGAKIWGIFDAAQGPTIFGSRAQRAAGVKPGPPAHGREPGCPFCAIFGGELIENGYTTVLIYEIRRKHGPHQMGTSLIPTKFNLNDDGGETLRRNLPTTSEHHQHDPRRLKRRAENRISSQPWAPGRPPARATTCGMHF